MLFYTVEELRRLPQPAWLLEGLLPAHGISVLFGQSGHGKSFVALDWALSIANGLPWDSVRAQSGNVLYIAAEGAHGYYKRVRAWNLTHGRKQESAQQPVSKLLFLTHPVLLHSQFKDAPMSLDALQERILATGVDPQLVIVDTLSRCTPGVEENASGNGSDLIFRLETLAARLNCAVLLVHHTTKSKKTDSDMRGSSTLLGAVNMAARVERKYGDRIAVSCTKMKDSEEFSSHHFRLSNCPTSGSCFLEPMTDSGPSEARVKIKIKDRALSIMLELVPISGIGNPEWLVATARALADAGLGNSDSSLKRFRKTLFDKGHVVETGDRIVRVPGAISS